MTTGMFTLQRVCSRYTKQAIDSIRALLSHENPRHAEVAAWLIGQIGDASDVARLKAQLPKQTDPLAKAALAMLGDAEGGQLRWRQSYGIVLATARENPHSLSVVARAAKPA